jgi:hypothetical protein
MVFPLHSRTIELAGKHLFHRYEYDLYLDGVGDPLHKIRVDGMYIVDLACMFRDFLQ